MKPLKTKEPILAGPGITVIKVGDTYIHIAEPTAKSFNPVKLN